jgi:hypothetical protein
MKTVICLLLLLVTLLFAQPAAAISGMCAAASFFNYQSEFFNTLCWIEIELNAGDEPPDQRSYPYGY